MCTFDSTGVITWVLTCPGPQGLAQWFIALGTVGAVFVATFGSWAKKRYYRPKIDFSIDSKSPYVVKKDSQVDNQNDSKFVEIKFGLKNTGRSSAGSSTEVCIDSFYKKVSDAYVEQLFEPVYLKDKNGCRLPTLVPKRSIYVPVVFLLNDAEKPEEDTLSATGTQIENYNAYIGNNKAISLGRGEFIIPIRFSAYKSASTAYLKIFWDSQVLDTSSSHLMVEFVDESVFNSLKKK